ncbi:MAG: methionine--tRNA ligase [Planctomycetes bacterium]|nr:methionine--tRNA ligase [Planctomycetota bacterium]
MPTESRPDDRPLLVTSALPYANGPLHFGHIAGAYLPADLFVRFHRLLGSDVLFLCGTDEHGVSITVNAEKEGKPYREYVDHWHGEIARLFERFDLSFDHFSRTSNVDPHYALSQEFFLRLLRAGAIAPRTTRQHFCVTDDRFLPDRYVVGTCYVCGGSARGDECKVCGSWLEAVKLIDPHCVICGNEPEVRDTMQYELDLSPVSELTRSGAARDPRWPTFQRWLVEAFAGGRLKDNVRTGVFDKLLVEGDGLRGRPITRDLPWGVPVPARDLDGATVEGHVGKVLYVWFDAPIGYVSATIEWARDLAHDADRWRRWWITSATHDFTSRVALPEGSSAEAWPGPRLVHFIGKDNIPFHCVVFPAMLGMQTRADVDEGDASGFIGPRAGERWVLPENVPANEFYNLEGKKFSTSDRWYLDNEHMFATYGVDALRWYVTVSMPETADSNFRFEGFAAAVNADLNDTLGNYCARVLKFVASKLDGRVPEPDASFEHPAPASDAGEPRHVRTVDDVHARLELFFASGGGPQPTLADRFGRYEFRRAADELLSLARYGNLLFDTHQPWKSRKLDDLTDCRTSLWAHCQIVSALAVALWPFLPEASDRLRGMLGLRALGEIVAERAPHRSPGVHESLWCWTRGDGSRPHALPAGHALGEPGILFRKIDAAQVEAELESLRGRAGT